MKLTEQEKRMRGGAQGPVAAEAIDYLIQLGEAFGSERLADISYCHYPAEMGIYEGSVEDLVSYSRRRGARVCVPTTTSTLCADLEKPWITGIPKKLAGLQAKVEAAHRAMGILETYTCTPQLIGFVPPFGSYIASVESSAIIYFNSVLGARTNRGGLFSRYSAVTGKYPLMGYLLPANRFGTHLFNVRIPPTRLKTYDAWCALGFAIGKIVGSEVPVIDGVAPQRTDWLIGLGAALATSGSVTLFHIPGVTPEARTVKEAFGPKRIPQTVYEINARDLDEVYNQMNTIPSGTHVDFVTLGCPHYNLAQIKYVAEQLNGKRIAPDVNFWICTNRMTRRQAEYSGYVKIIEKAGAKVVADTCPVESHMRTSTCREYGLPVPYVKNMVVDSVKMARYVKDLLGCKTVLTNTNSCIQTALSGRWKYE
ncbi:MAG: aconitase X catalytic domain-containing protein [Candidatus Brocadiia bacterium]